MNLKVKYHGLKKFIHQLIALWIMPHNVDRVITEDRYIEEHLTPNFDKYYLIITRVIFKSYRYFPWCNTTRTGYKVEIIQKIEQGLNVSHVEYFPEVLPEWMRKDKVAHHHIAFLIKNRLDSYR